MTEEDGFLGKLLENPADDTTRLVYADWLEERSDELSATKAEYVRLIARWNALPSGSIRRVPLEVRIRELANRLEAGWRGIVEGPRAGLLTGPTTPRQPPRPVDTHIAPGICRVVCEPVVGPSPEERLRTETTDPLEADRLRRNRERERRKARQNKRRV